ncbi:cysteine protease ATG4B [Cryptomeria japonica]|uniref:cysteine protease ATG4B n=1 Tax=Cryptomeria japonica TaxID=3369 RepID=UPI0025AC80CF|nr:cysteine protease ATG4B [Cryptomeria japonica]XP_057862572.1 cysteine protease ATG4B [Cryptomeria japonica]XP_057862573.1 cysteine protease ATG4B [Cryptomeria japonica]
MKGLSDSSENPSLPLVHSTCTEKELAPEAREEEQHHSLHPKATLWSSFISSFSVFESHSDISSSDRTQSSIAGTSGWTAAVRRAVASGPMRRLQERIMGPWLTGSSASGSAIWLLGTCYKILPDESSSESTSSQGFVDFMDDFSSRIWITYRKGFEPIEDTNIVSDVGWGCMLRSGQMLVAQALLSHHLGRSWRKQMDKPFDREYIEILQCFGDSLSEACPFSIHNILEAGKSSGLTAGSWLGPYALCRSLEALVRAGKERCITGKFNCIFPMAVYVVSGDEYGEHGGAPILCIDDAVRLCAEWSNGQGEAQVPLLILVPLLLGVGKINPRYIPSLCETFTFPQSLGMVGGKPGASTYMIGVQDDQALYLDPHEVQQVTEISPDNMGVDTSSYHCSVVRKMALSGIDPSLAIGFYCRNKDDFDDLHARATHLATQSNGAPLFTVTKSLNKSKEISACISEGVKSVSEIQDSVTLENENVTSPSSSEDDWEIV